MDSGIPEDHDRLIEEYRKKIIQKIEDRTIELPVVPKVATLVFQMLRDLSLGVKQYADVIQRDQALTAHVLKTANSAAYSASREIESINQATAMIGTKVLGQIALSITIKGNFYRVPGYEKEVKEMFRMALLSALFGEQLAKEAGMKPDIQFMCGLLHQVGKPLVMQLVSDINKDRHAAVGVEDALKLSGELHINAGKLIADSWKLPDFIRICIHFHDNFEEAPEYKNEAGMCALSGMLAAWALDGKADDEIINDTLFRKFGIDETGAQGIIGQKENIMERLSAMDS